MEDLYAVLGVSKNAGADEIKKAYRDAAFKHHPDRNPGNAAAEDAFKRINAAYSVLGDDAKRAEYDRYGSADSYAQAAYRNRAEQNGTQQDFADDPFSSDFWSWYEEAMKNGARGTNGSYFYRYTYGGQEQDSSEIKRAAFTSLLRHAVTFFLGLFFLRYSWILLPFGPILCLAAVVNGFTGAVRSLRTLFSPKTK